MMTEAREITLTRLLLGSAILLCLPPFTASAPQKDALTPGKESTLRYESETYNRNLDGDPSLHVPLSDIGVNGISDGLHDQEFDERDKMADYLTSEEDEDFALSDEDSEESRGDDEAIEENDTEGGTSWSVVDHANVNGCKIYKGKRSKVYCDCSRRNLTSVPTDLPSNITMLTLYINSIGSLPNNTFCNGSGHCLYCRLKSLVLAGNKISRLELNSFSCLTKLKYLNLKHNHLEMRRENFPVGVFEPLQNLTKLKINRNNPHITDRNLTYPDQAFGDLTRLRHLFLDGLPNTTFGVGFSKMKNLTTLTLSGYTEGFCRLDKLRNGTFENLRYLSFLNISDCFIMGEHYEPGALRPLRNLQVLDLTYNVNIGLVGLKKILKDISNTKLTTLIANSIAIRFSLSANITRDLVENLPKTITRIEARGNSFESVTPEVFDLLPENLTYLDLENNRFVFGRYLENLYKLKKLETLKLTLGSFLYNLPTEYPGIPRNGITVASRESLESNHGLDDVENYREGSAVSLTLRLPPKMRSFEMQNAGLEYVLSGLNVDPDNSLKNISLAYNYFPKATRPINGLHNLTYLDLRATRLQFINKTFFHNLKSLEILLLGSCQLRKYLSNAEPIFSDLINLEYLQLSDNRLNFLRADVFEGLDNLRFLNLGSNEIWSFTVNISHMHALRLVNLSHTELPKLPKAVRDHVDLLITRNVPITVDMSFTPIHCDCQNLEFLHWMVKSKAFERGGFRNYMCLYPDTSHKVVTDGYAEDIKFLEKHCADNYPVFLAVLGSTLVLLGTVVAGLIYRFRWKIRYLYYAAYLKFKVKDKDANRDGEFRYDVFISYAHNDEGFVLSEIIPELRTRGLKLHVHGRDFVVGDYIASNIAAAVMQSRKTMVVLTKNFIKSHWCNYEVQMANMEAMDTGRSVLVFLVKEPISNADLGVDLLYHIRNNTYTPYPQGQLPETDGEDFKAFWDKLARDLNS